jgi:hypothetical protein
MPSIPLPSIACLETDLVASIVAPRSNLPTVPTFFNVDNPPYNPPATPEIVAFVELIS